MERCLDTSLGLTIYNHSTGSNSRPTYTGNKQAQNTLTPTNRNTQTSGYNSLVNSAPHLYVDLLQDGQRPLEQLLLRAFPGEGHRAVHKLTDGGRKLLDFVLSCVEGLGGMEWGIKIRVDI